MKLVKMVACVVIFGLGAGLVWNQEAGKQKPEGKKVDEKSAKADEKPATHKVEKKPFKIERTVKGVLTPGESAEISYRPLAPSPSGRAELTIREVKEHGARV